MTVARVGTVMCELEFGFSENSTLALASRLAFHFILYTVSVLQIVISDSLKLLKHSSREARKTPQACWHDTLLRWCV